jgi:hypothetical protein
MKRLVLVLTVTVMMLLGSALPVLASPEETENPSAWEYVFWVWA